MICKLQTYGINGKLLNLMQDYLHSRQQRVVLSRQTSFWEKVLAVIPKGSVLGPLLFLICRNDIPEGIKSICKIFADDTSLFSIVKKDQLSQNNSDLKKISEWAHQWKKFFNPDSEFYFSRKLNQDSRLPLEFNDNTVQTVKVYNGLSLAKKRNSNTHIDNKINKCNKMIDMMKRLNLV